MVDNQKYFEYVRILILYVEWEQQSNNNKFMKSVLKPQLSKKKKEVKKSLSPKLSKKKEKGSLMALRRLFGLLGCIRALSI